MSRFLKVMIVLLTVAAMVVPAMATEFSVSGQMRVEGYYNDVDSADDSTLHWDQRFRINTVMKVSDEVKAVLRLDLGERQWGVYGQNTIRNSISNSWSSQIDKAYLQIDKEMFTLSAGQQYFGSPNAIMVDHVGTGIALTLKTPVTVKLQFTKFDENGSFLDTKETSAVAAVPAAYGWVDDDNDPATEPVWGQTAAAVPATTATVDYDDTNFYSLDVGFKNDAFSVNGIYAVLDNAATDDQKNGFGLAGSMKAGGFALKAELDLFSGDNGAGTDYVGTQFYLNANTAISDALSMGGWFMYAAGTDKADETVICDITNWDSFNPMWGGYVGSNVVSGAPITGWGPNNFIDNAGIIAFAVNATFNATDDLGFKFQGAYAIEEEDAVEDFDLFNLTASTKYKVAQNTYFLADVIYEDLDSDLGDDDSISFWTQLQVNF